MKIKNIAIILLMCAILTGCQKESSTCLNDGKSYSKEDKILRIDEKTDTPIDSKDDIPTYVQLLIKAYPDAEISFSDNCLTVNGEQITYDDGLEKTFIQKLDNCDVEDMFSMIYDVNSSVPDYLCDAGRGRCEALFKAMYGHSANEVTNNLVTVNWFDQKLKFTKINGANKQLEKVYHELINQNNLHKYFNQSSTFYWRKVRGANRQSAHSYGIAIDINVANSNYWLWANPHKSETDQIDYQNRIPMEIVRAFEKYGFIWGGRWYHFDTMHFEYRPEINYMRQS